MDDRSTSRGLVTVGRPGLAGTSSLLHLGPRRKQRALVFAATLMAATLLWTALVVPAAVPRAIDEVIWPDVFGETAVALLAIVWVLAINRLRTTQTAFLFFAVGAIALFVAALQAMLDQFLVFSASYPTIVENVGKVGGLLCVTAGLAAAGLERRRAEEELRNDTRRYRALSITDSLSKLFNHAFFLEELEAQVESAVRLGEPLSLILLDIDDFKRHNDDFGHLEGDKVINALGTTLRSTVRGTDIACRYGGEEFTVLLPSTPVDRAAEVAERIRMAFANIVFEPVPGVSVRNTISLGVAQLAPAEPARDLLRRADMAMFEAKRLGKNRVIVATPEPA
jgi:diguanylate cyclase (GGDEF)-like protein